VHDLFEKREHFGSVPLASSLRKSRATDMSAKVFLRDKHIQFIRDLDSDTTKQSYEYWLLEHLRMNGLYWGVAALATMHSLETLPKSDVVAFIESCWDSRYGGYGAFPKHDAHLLSTLSAIQILAIYEVDMDTIPHRADIVLYIKGLQLPDGSFQGDSFGEVDTRFVYSAINALSILGELEEHIVAPAVDFVMQCENFDGGFGMVPGAESHAAQVFVCVAALAICDSLHRISSAENLCEWLSERQVLPSGGLNGRPEKLPDVCYSWWVLSSLATMGKLHWIDGPKLQAFILESQDETNGGVSDRPGNQTDVYHTCFGIAGLALLESKGDKSSEFNPIDPVYCMPRAITTRFEKWPYTIR
jgi:geranylgeranyl transferase type-2 subunit beta